MKKIVNIIDEENNEGKYEICFSFDSKETQKSYVLYTSSKLDEFGKLIIQAGKYEVINEDTIKVDRNLTQEEFEMISQIMKEMINLANKNDEEENDLKNSKKV